MRGPAVAPSRAEPRAATRKQIRGSSLLLVGKLLSVGIKFLSQVVMVRYLSTADFGAWAYALALVTSWQGFAALGLDRSVTRFIPIYHERAQFGKLFGTLFLVVGTVLLTSFLAILTLWVLPDKLERMVVDGEAALVVLSILIFMVPLEALDGLLVGLFASFASPRAIFFRRHLVGPLLRLAVVLALVWAGAGVVFLAYGYLAASLLGVLIYSGVLLQLLHRQGLLAHFRWREVRPPLKELFSFTIPLMTSDLVSVAMNSVNVIILGYYFGPVQVAMYTVVLPAARLNKLVMTSFTLLYTPSAARLFAKGDLRGINYLYWQTAVWLALLSFPVFVMTFSLAGPLTVFLYGERYASSALLLSLLSLGYFFNVALGFNGLTLKVLGKLRYVVGINFAAVFFSVVLNLILIPRFGALGAAFGMTASLILHNILKQAGLRLTAGLSLFDPAQISLYTTLALAALGVFLVDAVSNLQPWMEFSIGAVACLVVFLFSRSKLKLGETFPELMRVPLVRNLLVVAR